MASPHGDVPQGCRLRAPLGRQPAQLGPDQIADYATRRAEPRTETEKWLGPYLDYQPE